MPKWCLTCESAANSNCCSVSNGSKKHSVIGLGSASIDDAEHLQNLIKDTLFKQALALEKTKSVRAHLLSLMGSLKQVEHRIKEIMTANELDLSDIMSLCDKNVLGLNLEEEVTVSTLRDTVTRISFQVEKFLKDRTNLFDELELQKRIRILLNLRNAENQTISTFSLFEDGFYSNWTTTEELSIDDRELMMMSHLVFSILMRYNIPLRIRRPPPIGSYFTSLPLESRMPRPLPIASASATMSFVKSFSPSTSPLLASNEFAFPASPEKEDEDSFSPPALSYSQVLNLPKPPSLPAQLPKTIDNPLPSFTIRFGEKGNAKYNVPSKYLGEVLVQQTLNCHVAFTRQMKLFCRKPQELTRSIMKVRIFFKYFFLNLNLFPFK